MRLSDLPSNLAIDVVRDGEFEHLGKTQHRKSRMLVFLEDEAFLAGTLANPDVSALLTTAKLATQIPSGYAVGVVGIPREVFYAVHDYLRTRTHFYGNDQPSAVDTSAHIDPAAYVSPVGVIIGPGCVVEPRAILLAGARLGKEVLIRAGATIGAEGFEFRKTSSGLRGIPHAGGVVLSDRVEIQNNSVVEKAPYGGCTVLGEDTKIGGAALVAHNCVLGRRCLVAGGVTISGNVTIGDDVWIGPGSTISNGLTLGDKAHVTIGAVVVRNVPAGASVSGNFAMDHRQFLRSMSQHYAQAQG